jgi:DNA repair protein RadC
MQNIKEYKLKSIESEYKQVQINSSDEAVNYIRQFYFDDIDIYESFFILMLNRANITIGYAKISQGGISGAVVDVRIIMKYCIDSLCSGVILSHNHPSGNVHPSEQDIAITKRLKEAGKILDVNITDHVILTKDSYYSFVENGII